MTVFHQARFPPGRVVGKVMPAKKKGNDLKKRKETTMFFPIGVVVMALAMFALMYPVLWIAYGIVLLLAIAYVVSADHW